MKDGAQPDRAEEGGCSPAARLRSFVGGVVPFGLARRFARALVGLVTVAMLTNSAVSVWLSYEEARASATRVLQEKAHSAAQRVAEFVTEIEGQMGWTAGAEWTLVGNEQRRYDMIRLLRQAPAIADILYIDGNGREQMRLSRLEPDVVGSGADLSSDPRFARAVADRVWYGPVYFRFGSEPYMRLSLAHAGRRPGVTVATVNLKLIWDVVTAIRVGETGYAFVTDSAGRLIAHPDMSLVLRGMELSQLPQVAAAIGNAAARSSGGRSPTVAGPGSGAVLSVHAPIPALGWFVFVEMPQRELLAPVLATLYHALALLGASILLAILFAGWLGRRMVVPIRRLQAAAQRLGEGDLGQRIPVTSRDEIGALADRFNIMAERVQEAQETLESKVVERTRELARSLDELRAAQDRLIQTEKLASLGQLTAGIAHEIRNPLNFVNNFAELSIELARELEDALAGAGSTLGPDLRGEIGELVATLRDNLSRVAQHGRRADSIIRNMLAHSREGGGAPRRADLNALVEEALNLAYHAARTAKTEFSVSIRKSLDPTLGELELHPQEFTRVLLNLIGNSFDAVHQRRLEGAPPGFKPTVEVATRALVDHVELRVRDNGGGIPEEVKDRIFEPFFTTKPPGEGTGLGLSLSREIVVKQHGGTIDLATEPGEATEFIITLPRPALLPMGESHDRADPGRGR